MDTPRFLSLEDIERLHDIQIRRYGGLDGLRDMGLLESALAQPAAAFGDTYLHSDLFEMAAAYLFHLAKNHPYLDGNKRVALHAAYVFLSLNGIELTMGPDALYDLVIAVAEGRLDKPEIAAAFRENSRPADA